MVMYILPFIETDSEEKKSLEEKMDHAFEELLEGWAGERRNNG
jgi:hypothetical protein